MTAPDFQIEASFAAMPHGASSPRLLAAALLHVLERDEAPPARWQAEAFVLAVSRHRLALAEARSAAELDHAAAPGVDPTFRSAVAALGSDALAAALAVRHLELSRQAPLPAWPVIVRRGVGPRVTHADAARWFG